MLQFVKYIFPVLFFFPALTSVAQSAGKRVFTINGNEGDEPKILSLYQNKQGYILAGTTKGLYRFDGLEFYRYKPFSDSVLAVTAIGEGANDQLWVGFESGVLAYVENNQLRQLSFEEGFPKAPIKKIAKDKAGTIWIATAGEGLYYLKGKRLYNINEDDGLSDSYLYDLAIADEGYVNVTTDRGLNIIHVTGDKKNIEVFSSKDGLPDNILRSIYGAGNFYWLGMQDAGVACINKKQQLLSSCKQWEYGQVNNVIGTSSQVFIATEDKGLVVYDHDEKNNITTLSYKDDRLKKITCLLRDRESNVWAAGDNYLMRTAGSTIEVLYTLPKATAEKVHAILAATDKSIWFNNGNTLSSIDRKNGQWKQKDWYLKDVGKTDISCLFQDSNGIIWVGTLGSGIILVDPEKGTQQLLSGDSLLVNANIISISGRNSEVWISAFEGIVCAKTINGKTTFVNYTGIEQVGSNYTNFILPDSKNRVWFATDGKGLTLLEQNRFVNLRQQTEKFGSVIYRIAEDNNNNVWYSTYKNGIVKYNGKDFYNYTKEQGLSDLNITGLASIRENIVVMHKDKLDILNVKNGSVSYIDDEQGIGNINTDFNAYTTDKEGNLYFISDTGILRYHASYYTSLQPTVLIDNVQLFLEDVEVRNGHVFSYNENNISFQYAGLYYSQPDRVTYQYKLDGYDKTWVYTKDKKRNFPQLPPGSYVFRVKASLNGNFSIAPEARFMFTIEEPFWMNTWFIIFCICAFIGIVFLIIKSRERTINKYNRLEREKIKSQLDTLRSQINPHFLFNSFNTLISEIEEDPSTAVTYVEKLSDFYRSIVMNREKDLILLQEEMSIMQDYAFIQRKRYGKAIQVKNSITPDQEKQYYITPLALQLLIENAIKHNVVSLETPLNIELYINEEEYLVVKNAINKKLQEDKGSRMGLQNIRKRYELLSRKAVIIENDQQYFTVKIPLLKSPV